MFACLLFGVVAVLHALSFGDLKTLWAVFSLRPIVAFQHPGPEKSANGAERIVQELVVRNLSLSTVRLIGVSEDCDSGPVNFQVCKLTAFQEMRILVWIKPNPNGGEKLFRIFHSFSDQPICVGVCSRETR